MPDPTSVSANKRQSLLLMVFAVLLSGLSYSTMALAQLQALLSEDLIYEEGAATQDARLEYAAERLRLLYVGITRARKELILTWNTGRRGDQQPAVPFIALQTFWEERPGP